MKPKASMPGKPPKPASKRPAKPAPAKRSNSNQRGGGSGQIGPNDPEGPV